MITASSRQDGVVPASVERQLVVGQNVGAFLRLAQARQLDHRYRGHPELSRREQPPVARYDAILAAVSMAWDRDLQERLLQLIERMVLAHEAQTRHLEGIYKSQEVLADQRQIDMNEKLDDLLARMEDS